MGVIFEALENVLPYITNIEKMKNILRDCDKCEDAIKYLEDEIAKANDVTIKTDLRIVLNEVLRMCRKFHT